MAYRFKHGDRPLQGFTIQRGAGRGGFGEVYYARSDGGREVALKYLTGNPDVELRGVSACMNLKSPHLVQVFDIKRNREGEYFVVMEYIAGPTLRDMLIAEPKGLGVSKAAYFVREIGKGLSYLHDRGIVHRDLKPGNIFYEDGYVKIGDYGLSKFLSVSRHSAQTASVGTVHYMAPEVGSGNYSRGIDIYALGVMLYEMLLGRVPFEGASMGEVLIKHLTEQPEVDALPQPFGPVIRKALAKAPDERYQQVDAMVGELFEADEIRISAAEFRPSTLAGVPRQPADEFADSPSPVQPPPPVPQPATAQAVAGGAAAQFAYPAGPAEYAALAVPNSDQLSREWASGWIRYAGFWRRLAAAFIDCAVVGAASACILTIFTGNLHSDDNPFYLVCSVAYHGMLIGRWNGQTLGKKVLGIKVISSDGRVCGRWQAFGRTLSELLSILTLGIGYLMVAFDDRKRGLHDRIAGTLHVRALE